MRMRDKGEDMEQKTKLFLSRCCSRQLHMFVVVITLLNLSGARRQGGHPDCQVCSELHLASIKTVKFNNLLIR
jgi:hypothetical protein